MRCLSVCLALISLPGVPRPRRARSVRNCIWTGQAIVRGEERKANGACFFPSLLIERRREKKGKGKGREVYVTMSFGVGSQAFRWGLSEWRTNCALACGGDRGIKESNPDLGARKQASKHSYRDGDRKEASVQSPASPLACWEGHTTDFFF